MTRITSIALVSMAVALSAAPPQQQTPPPTQTPPPQTATVGAKPPAPQAPQAPQTTNTRPGNLLLTVFAESGTPLSGAVLSVRGAVDRGGTTSASGQVAIQNLPAGTYRGRISRDGFITFEKELVIKAGTRLAAEAVLSVAPPPPAAPAPPPSAPDPKPATPVLPAGTPGVAKILSIPDLFQQMSRDPQPVVEREIGCSGNSSSRVILARQPITMHNHADADEMFYIVAGEGVMKVGDREENVGPGWYSLVPRGIVHSLTPRGRNAPFILSVRSGPVCG